MISEAPAAVSLLYEIHKNDGFRIFGMQMYCNGREVIIRLKLHQVVHQVVMLQNLVVQDQLLKNLLEVVHQVVEVVHQKILQQLHMVVEVVAKVVVAVVVAKAVHLNPLKNLMKKRKKRH